MKMLRVTQFPIALVATFLLLEFLLESAGSLAEVPPLARTEPSLAIVVNQVNPTENLSFAELRKIFLGERSHWPHGRRIAVAMLQQGQPERQAVLREIYRMSEDEYRDHFLKGLFTGEVFVSPKTLESPTVVRKFVFNAPGAIGYLRANDVDESVKIVRIDGHLPDDKDYRLQIDAQLKH
jgi:ABC-type phosphate transport system substrate-binding protein